MEYDAGDDAAEGAGSMDIGAVEVLSVDAIFGREGGHEEIVDDKGDESEDDDVAKGDGEEEHKPMSLGVSRVAASISGACIVKLL